MMGVLKILPFPFLLLAAALDVGDEGVEGDVVVIVVVGGRGEGEVGAELEAAVAVGGIMGFGGVVGEEEKEENCC